MNPNKRKSIQSFLASRFILFSLFLLVLMTGIMCLMQYRTARDETIQALRQASLSVADSVDQHLNQMNQVSLNAISSTELRDAFQDYYSTGLSAYEHNQTRLRLANAMTTAKGFDFSIRQLNLYPLLEGGFGTGEKNGDLDEDANAQKWYEEAVEKHGRPVVSVNGGYISLSRMFFNTINVPTGYAEVQKKTDIVFSLARNPGISYPAALHIYDKDGRLLFSSDYENSTAADTSPESSSSEDTAALQNAPSGDDFDYYSLAGGEQILQTRASGKNEIVCFARSDKLGLTVAVSARRNVYLRQIYGFLYRIIPIFLLEFVLLLLLSFLISRRISFPIRHIYHFLSDETKDKFQLLDMEYTRIREIDKLHDSINENILATKASTDTMMILKEQEVQAQMLSLQSQMNPHFLYNSLSAIGEMAQEGLTEPVAGMCSMITEIMRYISSNREQRSSLEEELEICDMYLNCLKMRYQEHLTWDISVDDDMLDLLIPKLCIQLLVENAVRSITTQAPPWHIDITCVQKNENWYVTVSDNGPGFDSEVDKRLRKQMDQILETGTLPSLKIQGMGILNIFIRLYLLDGIPFIFDMGNLPEGGAFVTIGGRLAKAEQNGDVSL